MDGLTTNGVLVMHPEGFPDDSKQGAWREISVCGDVYSLRETRSGPVRGQLVRMHACTHARTRVFKMPGFTQDLC